MLILVLQSESKALSCIILPSEKIYCRAGLRPVWDSHFDFRSKIGILASTLSVNVVRPPIFLWYVTVTLVTDPLDLFDLLSRVLREVSASIFQIKAILATCGLIIFCLDIFATFENAKRQLTQRSDANSRLFFQYLQHGARGGPHNVATTLPCPRFKIGNVQVLKTPMKNLIGIS